MTEGRIEIPAAIEDGAKALARSDGERFGVGGRWDYLAHDRQERHRAEAAAALEAAYPHLLAAFKDELLSEGPVEAAKSALRVPPGDYLQNHHVRRGFKAALASIDSDADTSQGGSK